MVGKRLDNNNTVGLRPAVSRLDLTDGPGDEAQMVERLPIGVAPLAGGPARNLTRTSDRDEFAPHWSPDGELLVVTAVPRQPPGRAGDKIDPAETRVVVLDRSGRVLLETDGMMADWMPPF